MRREPYRPLPPELPRPGKTGTAADLIPPRASLRKLREIAAGCTACPLYANATRTVFGEGPEDARLMLVGETPGDQEDRAGRPFVGPAGVLLDKCLEAAGIDRNQSYVTNVVKHFKWTQRGKKRLHQKPNTMEIRACAPWLEAEIAHVKPAVIVGLGATAAQALFGRDFRVSRSRGRFLPSEHGRSVMATVHPSSLLRAELDREEQIMRFIDDLKIAAAELKRVVRAAS